MKTQKHRLISLAVVGIVFVAAGCQGQSQGQGSAVPSQSVGSTTDPRIEFAEVPHADCGGPNRSESIAGKVTGVPPGQNRLVIYVMACNGTLYVQPTVAAPLITIEDNGSFDSYIHLGEMYYGLLVRPTFKPKPELTEVPQRGGDILVVAKVRGRGAEGGGKKN